MQVQMICKNIIICQVLSSGYIIGHKACQGTDLTVSVSKYGIIFEAHG